MPAYAVTLRDLAGVPLAVMRRQVNAADLSRAVPEMCGRVWNALLAQGMRGGRHVAVYLDDTVRIEVGVELLQPFTDTGQVVRSETPAGPTAMTTYYGPYGGLGLAHDAIHEWCRVHGHRLTGRRWEIYGHWLSEWDTDPSQIRTDVFYEVAGVTKPAEQPPKNGV